jgi:biopolymer transport protein TolQ
MIATGIIAVVAQIGGAVPSSPGELVRHATPVTQGVLILLALLSLVSWAVMLGAWREIARTLNAGRALLRELEKTTRLEQASALIRHAPASPFTRLYMVAMQFVSDTRALNQQVREREMDDPVIAPPAVSLTGSQVETLHLILDTEAMGERDRLGRYLPWLATIGSVSPLIGLLGTVLGVIDAFVGIARSGSGNLSAVAPGVAEALVATAAALAVAIPATFAYNIFASRLNRIEGLFETFGTTMIALLVREGHI